MQEFYEGSEHTGKIFTLEEYEDYYTKKWGAFTYYSDWSGFNIPSSVVDVFMAGKFDPLSEYELRLLDSIDSVAIWPIYYVIGTYNGRIDVLKHEIAHALYYTNSAYRAEVLKLLSSVNLLHIFKVLESKEYNSATWVDEAHAYMMTEIDFLESYEVRTIDFHLVTQKLNEIFERYAPDAYKNAVSAGSD